MFRIISVCRLWGKDTPYTNWACFFFGYLKIINTFVKNDISILKKFVWETQKGQWNFRRPSGSWVIVQSMQSFILNQNSRTDDLRKLEYLFLSFSDNVLLDTLIFKKVPVILR